MSNKPTSFPLFNRVVVLLLSSVTVILSSVSVVTWMRQHAAPDVATVFSTLVLFAMGCAGIWLSLCWRNKTADELEAEQAFLSVEHPEIPDHALVYRFSTGRSSSAIFVDEEGGEIHFANCYTPRKLFSTAKRWFSCPISKVRGIHVFRYGGESLTVVTEDGKAIIPSTGSDYAELRNTLKRLVPYNQPGFSTDHPAMGLVYVAGALTGLFTGVLLTPVKVNDSILGLLLLAGAVLGVVVPYLLVYVGDRWLKAGLAQPIGYGMAGVMIGISLSSMLGPFIGWSPALLSGLVSVSGILGFSFGVRKQHRESGPSARCSDQ